MHPDPLHTLRLIRLLAAMVVLLLVALAIAPVRPYFAEWRDAQRAYNRLAADIGAAPVAIEVKQIWRPALGVTDRCVTCHLGMAGTATPIAGHALFGPHPPGPHEPRELGCTLCHGGQGRATSARAAHGFVSHWDEQMLDARDVSAGCGTCHDEFPPASRRVLREGARLVEQLDCLSCHRLDGRGRGTAELSYVGLTCFRGEWHAEHLAMHQAGASEAWRTSYGPIGATELTMLDRFLRTRVGAPRIVEARAVAQERGCLGCHKLRGLGGDEGPPLDAVGRKPVAELDFTQVPGERTFPNYVREHLIDPARVVPGSAMPPQDYASGEIELLTSWVLFLRSRALPAAFLPKDRVRREVLGEAPMRLEADQVFGAYCSACHGMRGEGRTYGNSTVRYPAIGSADFLNVASDELIARTIATGRPGRRMPALAGSNGTLADEDVAGLIAYLRGLPPSAPPLSILRTLATDRDTGRHAYADQCSTCHGGTGEGTPLGPPLGGSGDPAHVERYYNALVRGVRGTAMPAYADRDPLLLASVLRDILAWRAPASRDPWRQGQGDPDRGASVYERVCAGCHGAGRRREARARACQHRIPAGGDA